MEIIFQIEEVNGKRLKVAHQKKAFTKTMYNYQRN